MGLILLAVAVLAALIVDYIFTRVIKTITRLSKTELDDKILNNLHGPMRTSVILFAVLVAMDVYLEEQTWQGPLINIIYSIIIIVWTVYLVRTSRMIFRTLRERTPQRAHPPPAFTASGQFDHAAAAGARRLLAF